MQLMEFSYDSKPYIDLDTYRNTTYLYIKESDVMIFTIFMIHATYSRRHTTQLLRNTHVQLSISKWRHLPHVLFGVDC
jgi:hypothetical protein